MASTIITDNGENGKDYYEKPSCKVDDPGDSDDDISVSSDDDSSSDDENRPPEKINIERSIDLASVKSAFTGQRIEPKIAGAHNHVQEELEKMRLDKENNSSRLTQTFETFGAETEHLNNENRPSIDIRRNNSVKNRVKRVFFDAKNPDSDGQSSKNCCGVCQILVKSSDAKETIIRLKKAGIFHRKCFKCADCYKILTPKEYWIIGQSYYCKFHALKREHTDQEITVEMVEDMQTSNEQPDDEEICDFFLLPEVDDDDEDFALVTQPKPLDPDVIKSGTKLESDFPRGIGLTALQEKKKTFSSSFDVEDSRKSIDTDQIDCQMIKQGQVKNRLSRFGQSNGNAENDESIEDEDYQNANICRSAQKKREELHLDVDAKSLKSKFENAASSSSPSAPKLISPPLDFDQRTAELNALKSTSGVTQTKEKFIAGVADNSDSPRKQKASDEITPVAAASIQEAKEKFMKGDFGDSAGLSSAEKFREPIPFTELISVRERYEQNAASASNGCETRRSASPSAAKIAAGRCAELTTLKASFESGGKKKFTNEELEQRRKKHLEAEFKRLQIEKGIFNEKQRREAEEEAKNLKACSNQDSSDQEVQKCPELNALKQRFEFNEQQDSAKQQQTPVLEDWTPAEEAKLIKAKFESHAFENAAAIDNEEKLKTIRAEFEHFKEMKQNDDEKNSEIDQQTPDATATPQQDLAAAAEYAQKMRAKWDKIQKKEAKKAQKAANAKQKVTSPLVQTCHVCQKRAYPAESIECDCKLYHVTCFKCKKCGCCLRLENCFTGPDGVYCKNHFKLLFGSFSKVRENDVNSEKNSVSEPVPASDSENLDVDEKIVFTNSKEEDIKIYTQILERDSDDGLFLINRENLACKVEL
uniref:LIM zinc-binding domain-containing protein n=1 Tax=Romanomermis culicivorax TaxID=13658 RepID=A0A915JMR3_ROMCU